MHPATALPLLLLLVSASSQAPPFNCTSQPPGAFTPVELRSPSGLLRLSFLPYGGTVQRLILADPARGIETDVVLGFDDATQYCANAVHPYFGAIIGRVANRIAGGSFSLDGKTYTTPVNEPAGGDTLHGGWVGFDRHVWAVELAPGGAAATLRRTSADGEQGFPGALDVAVTCA